VNSLPADAAPRRATNELRPVDWRFLTGHAHFARAVCDARAELTAAVSAVSEEIVDPGSGVECSVAVLSNPTIDTLRRVHEQLAPGAICYSEWLRPGSARRARAVERAGFTIHERYATWPPPRRASPAFWLPVSRPRAIDYFLATRPLPRGGTKRLFARAARRTWRIARRLGLLAPFVVLASKPAGDANPPAVLASTLIDGWPRWGLGHRPTSLGCLMLTGGRSELNKIVVLAFADDEPEPRLAIKFARTPASVTGLQREAASLQAVAQTTVPEVADVPRLVFAEQLAGVFAIGETVIAGRPLQLDLTRATYRDRAVLVTDTLRALVPENATLPVAAWWPRLVTPVLAAFRERFATMVDPRRIDDVEQQLRGLPPLPLVPEQRDCSPWNVLVAANGRLALLDWESAEPSGLPALDLWYFLAHAAFVADGTLGTGREMTTYEALRDEQTMYGRVASEMTERYAGSLALDTAMLNALRPFMWMVHAIGEYDRSIASFADDTPDPGRAAARASLFLRLWQRDVKDTTVV
jgi:hypothetical protein